MAGLEQQTEQEAEQSESYVRELRASGRLASSRKSPFSGGSISGGRPQLSGSGDRVRPKRSTIGPMTTGVGVDDDSEGVPSLLYTFTGMKSYTTKKWYQFRLATTMCDLVLLSVAVDQLRSHADLAPVSRRPKWSHFKVVGDALVLIDVSLVTMKAYYLRTKRIPDGWIVFEIVLTWLTFLFQAAYWPVHYFYGPGAALRVLAFAALRAFRAFVYLRRMREILSALLLSYKEFASSFMLLLIGTAIFTTLFLCFFEPTGNSLFEGFISSFMTTVQVFTLHKTKWIILHSSSSGFMGFVQFMLIMTWVFIGSITLRNVITAFMVGSILRRRKAYEKSEKERARMELSRRARRRMKEIFPLFYQQSIYWANRDPHYLTISQLIQDVRRMFADCKIWRKTWLAAIPYLKDCADETIWPVQPLVYYETALNCLVDLLNEDKFLILLTQEVALISINERLNAPDPAQDLAEEMSLLFGEDTDGEKSEENSKEFSA